ncbi:unnamed protein product, partial [Prorocentrum cordatum]
GLALPSRRGPSALAAAERRQRLGRRLAGPRSPGAGRPAPAMSHVEQLKQLQPDGPGRQGAVARLRRGLWEQQSPGPVIRDPAKHDVTFIDSFITQYQSGARLQWQEGEEFILELGQRKSGSWKSCWEMYANQKPIDGKPKHDPAHTPPTSSRASSTS